MYLLGAYLVKGEKEQTDYCMEGCVCICLKSSVYFCHLNAMITTTRGRLSNQLNTEKINEQTEQTDTKMS